MKAFLIALFASLFLAGCGSRDIILVKDGSGVSGKPDAKCDGYWQVENNRWTCKESTAAILAAPVACAGYTQPVYTGTLWTCMTPDNAAYYGYLWRTYPYQGWYQPQFVLQFNYRSRRWW